MAASAWSDCETRTSGWARQHHTPAACCPLRKLFCTCLGLTLSAAAAAWRCFLYRRSTCPWTCACARPAPSAAASPRHRWVGTHCCSQDRPALARVSLAVAFPIPSASSSLPLLLSALSLPRPFPPADQRHDREGGKEGARLPAAQVCCQGRSGSSSTRSCSSSLVVGRSTTL